MAPIFAVGDIHGQIHELERALSCIEADPDAGAPVVFLGDYCDRGPDTRGVIDILIDGQSAGRPWVALMGNHDRYMRNFLAGRGLEEGETLPWRAPNMGGRETLASYGVDADPRRDEADIRADAIAAVPAAHRAFLDGLATMHVTDAQIFVHAGIRPGIALDAQAENDLVWIRAGFLEDPRDHGRLVVHGHTAGEFPSHHGNRVNLDGGAAYGNPLVPAVIEGRRVHTLDATGRSPLLPRS